MSAELAAPAKVVSVTMDGALDSNYFAFLLWRDSMSPTCFGTSCTVKAQPPTWGSHCCGPRVTSPNSLQPQQCLGRICSCLSRAGLPLRTSLQTPHCWTNWELQDVLPWFTLVLYKMPFIKMRQKTKSMQLHIKNKPTSVLAILKQSIRS